MATHDKFDPDWKQVDPEDEDKEYLTPNEASSFIGTEVASADDIDDLVMTLDTEGIDLTEGELPSQRRRKTGFGLDDQEELDTSVAPSVLDKTSDPVRLYLREMGTVPLLTRQGEIEIAKRFERGHLRVLKAISRCPIVIREITTLGADLESGARSIKEVVVFNEEDVTDDILSARTQATIDEIEKWWNTITRPRSWRTNLQASAASKIPSRIAAASGSWDGKELRFHASSAASNTLRRKENG